MMEFNLIHIIPMLAMSELSRQVVHESTLAQRFKSYLKLNYDQLKKWQTLSKPLFWLQLTGKWFYVLMPILLIVMLFSIVMALLTEILDCDRCFGYHLGWIMMLILQYPILQALLFAPIVIIGIYFIEYLLAKSQV